jgi:hypothetical protein
MNESFKGFSFFPNKIFDPHIEEKVNTTNDEEGINYEVHFNFKKNNNGISTEEAKQ